MGDGQERKFGRRLLLDNDVTARVSIVTYWTRNKSQYPSRQIGEDGIRALRPSDTPLHTEKI